MDELLRSAYEMAALPPPAWSLIKAPGYGFGNPTNWTVNPAAFDFAVSAVFPFLQSCRFVLVPSSQWTWGWPAAPFIRADATILICFKDDSFFLLAAPTPGKDLHDWDLDKGIIGALTSDYSRTRVTFGSFPIIAQDTDSLVARLRPFGEAIEKNVEALLKQDPLDLESLKIALQKLQEQIVGDRWEQWLVQRTAESWSAGRNEIVVSSLNQLKTLRPLNANELSMMGSAGSNQFIESPKPSDVTPEQWTEHLANSLNDRYRELKCAAELRDSSRDASFDWEESAIGVSRALHALYGWLHQLIVQPLGNKDEVGVEAALSFLESDIRCFRSGYFREYLLRRLRRLSLNGNNQVRAWKLGIRIIDNGGGRELRDYFRLSARYAGPDYINEIRSRLNGDDIAKNRRALWALSQISAPADSETILNAQEALIKLAAGGVMQFRFSINFGQLVKKFWSVDFGERLSAWVIDPKYSSAAIRIIGCSPYAVPTVEWMVSIIQLWILNAIDTRSGESSLANLAFRVASPEFESDLNSRLDSPDPEVRQFATQALKGIAWLCQEPHNDSER